MILDEATLPLLNEVKKKSDYIKSILDPLTITIKVRFRKFEVRWDKLESLPQSRLGKIRYASNMHEVLSLCDEVNIEKNELYFNASARSFECIIDYYYSKHLHMNTNSCIISLTEELDYWGIDSCAFDACCSFKFHQMQEDALIHLSKLAEIENSENAKHKETFHKCCFPELRRNVWDIMEYPETSTTAKVNC